MAMRSDIVHTPTHFLSVPCTALTQLEAVANGRARRCQPPLCRQARGARACGSWARARLPGEGLQQRARDVRRARRPGQAQDGAARIRAPVRRQQPAERRHKEHACAPRSGVGARARPHPAGMRLTSARERPHGAAVQTRAPPGAGARRNACSRRLQACGRPAAGLEP